MFCPPPQVTLTLNRGEFSAQSSYALTAAESSCTYPVACICASFSYYIYTLFTVYVDGLQNGKYRIARNVCKELNLAFGSFGENSQTLNPLKILVRAVVVDRVMQPLAVLEYNLLYATWLLFCMGTRRSFQTMNPSDYTLEDCF